MKIIHHSRDLDGYCSGAILKKRFPHGQLIPYDYGQAIPQIDEGDEVILVDVSFPMPAMIIEANKCKSFTWIDHHISAIKEFNELNEAGLVHKITPFLKDGIAACELAWVWAFPDIGVPMAVNLLGMYDTWRNHDKKLWDTKILPFQYGMRTMCNSADSFPYALLDESLDEELDDIIQLGQIILDYQKDQYAIAAKSAFTFEWKGCRCIALNGAGFSSMAFESVYDEEKHDIMMPFKFDGTKWVFSLYTTKEIDCSALAKSMGGGGHKKAAGFSVQTLDQIGIKA